MNMSNIIPRSVGASAASEAADKPSTAVVLHLYPNQREEIAEAVKWAMDLQTGSIWSQELEDHVIAVAEQAYSKAIRSGKRPYDAAFAAACSLIKNGGRHE
jgi:hypothetical protein